MLEQPAETPGASDDELTLQLKTALSVTVARRIKEAQDARQSSGIEDIWEEDADQYDGIDSLSSTAKNTSGEQKPREDGRSKVFLNITKPKTDTAVARVQGMLVPTDERPFSFEPTPIPEFAKAADGEGADQMLTLADGTQAPADKVAKIAMDRATKAAEAMEDWVEDRFVEGDVYSHLRRIIEDAGRLGTGVLKGPFPIARRQQEWTMADGVAVLQITEEVKPTSKRVDPRDLFPDPACGENLHNGSYVCERDYLTARQLKQLARLDGYDAEAIAAALKAGPQHRARDRDRYRDQPGESVLDSEVFEVWYYYGDVEPETLIAMGVGLDEISDTDLQLQSVPSMVTMVNGQAIKAVVNPLESGEFPYDVFPWERRENQIWGIGIPRKMAVAQRMLNAATRAMLENAGISAGPQIAIAEGVLTPANGKYEIVGRKLWKFNPTDLINDIGKAMQVWNIPSAQAELANIIAFAQQMADQLTNLPMLMQGEQGTAPELLGGMKMLMANASAPLRMVAKTFDDQIIVPHLKRYYGWGMQEGPEEAKGDLQIKARGSSALLQREIASEFLPVAHQLSQRPGSKFDPDRIEQEMARAAGVTLASISFTEEELQQRAEAQAQQPAPQDPRIEAAKIKAQADQQRIEAERASDEQRLQFEAQRDSVRNELDRYIAEIQFQIQAMETANRKDISLADLKAMLAAKAIESRDKRELFAAERAMKFDPANRDPQNQGI